MKLYRKYLQWNYFSDNKLPVFFVYSIFRIYGTVEVVIIMTLF